MSLTGGLHAMACRGKIGETAATPASLAGRSYAEPERALVVSHLGQLVDDGYAEWSALGNGNMELRLFTGEIFLLGDTSITRVI